MAKNVQNNLYYNINSTRHYTHSELLYPVKIMIGIPNNNDLNIKISKMKLFFVILSLKQWWITMYENMLRQYTGTS